jgi:RNA polymerase sigma-70 factor (ECF subfamily)
MQPNSPGQCDGPADPKRIDWQSVLQQHERWLRTIVYARVGEPQAVDDVMQEVALAAVRQKAPLSDPNKVAPWLYRLAVTQSLLYRRKQGRRRRLTDNYTQRVRPTEHSREVEPLGWLLADERRQLIRAALSRLAKRDAEILLLKYTEDWSYQELARHLDVSVSAVQARLHRARQRLRGQLASREVIESEDQV